MTVGMGEDLTLSEVVKVTGAKRRSVQLWADAGIIRAVAGTDRAGTGTHRRFSVDEVKIVAILARLAMFGLSIGWLKYFASEFRKVFPFPLGPFGSGDKERAQILERASKDNGQNYLVFSNTEKSLYFELISDERSDAVLDLADVSAKLDFFGQNQGFIGIIDLNHCLRGLSE